MERLVCESRERWGSKRKEEGKEDRRKGQPKWKAKGRER